MTQADRVKEIAAQMLRDELNGFVSGRYDDWQSRTVFEVGDQIRVRCVFTNDEELVPSDVNDYIWLVRDVTTIELGIEQGPTPTTGGTAIVECDVVEKVSEEKVRLGHPKIIEFELSDATVDDLKTRI
ncbi:hypothetical protein [Salinibaculum rarum]|uniref:hypothetical protein n=1 Tax=Salinibaculum rarum TaxID=3058903 RepID=UPI00265FC65F|nr:hypothetical protein [Salinibaculum sp. KK48]